MIVTTMTNSTPSSAESQTTNIEMISRTVTKFGGLIDDLVKQRGLQRAIKNLKIELPGQMLGKCSPRTEFQRWECDRQRPCQ